MKTLSMFSTATAALVLTSLAANSHAQNKQSAEGQQSKGPVQDFKNLKFPPLDEFKPTEPVIKELKNGLKVYLMEDHELPLVRVRAMVRVGAAYESKDKTGLSSVVANVMRSGGTKQNPGDKLDDELGALAASIDFSIGTISGGGSASCLSEKLPRVVELFADVMRNPDFPENKIELARTAMRASIARRNDQIGAMGGRAFQIAMYGKDSILAREPEYATVEAIQRADLQQFHDKYFRADRTAIGFVGSFDSNKVMEMLEKHFGDWKKSEEPLPKVDLDPLAIEGRSVYFSDKDDVNQTNLFIGGIGVRRDDPDWAAVRVGSFVLGAGGFSSRMMKKVRTELGLAYSVGAGIGAEYERVGLFRALCQTKSSTTAQAIEAMLGEIEGILASPPTEQEVQLAKDQILNAEVFDYATKAGILSRRMSLDYYNYPPDFVEQLNRKIRAVSAKEVGEAYKRHLHPKNLKIVAVGNSKDFDKPLSTYGKVTTIDLSIPAPPMKGAAPVSAAAVAAGGKATDALFAKMGGRDAWKSLESLRLTMDTSREQPGVGRMDMKVTETIALPAKSHMVINVATPMGEFVITRCMDGDSGWMKGPNPMTGSEELQPLPAQQIKQTRADRRCHPILMFQRLAAGELEIASADGKLSLMDNGAPIAKLTLGDDGLVKVIEYTNSQGKEAVSTIDEYKETSGMRFASSWNTKDGQTNPEIKITALERNVKVDPAIFVKPAEGAGSPTSSPAKKD